MLNSITFSIPDELKAPLDTAIKDWSDGKIARIWQRDGTIWTNGDESKWLGWLDIVEGEIKNLPTYKDLVKDIGTAGFNDVLLMGMGGSSLCPEVLATTFGRHNFHILDSTVPEQIRSIESRIDLEKTLFIVASKSGSTLEPNCFKQYFFEKLSERVGKEAAGRQFIAITDPGSKMEAIARSDGFRQIAFGKPDIGGRFSALSAFGLTAAASMKLDVEEFLRHTLKMVEACHLGDAAQNPGALLGAILGICHSHGHDKLTIHATNELYDLGAWLEQLIAESTGKSGKAIIPIDREPSIEPAAYSRDRLFAVLALRGDAEATARFNSLVSAGHPAVLIELESTETLGQEFFRWEFATAVAGSIMAIDPFNQPDVEAAKIEARKLTDQYEALGKLPDEHPFLQGDSMSLFTSDEYATTLGTAASGNSIDDMIRAHLSQLGEGDYFALLAYVQMSPEHESVLTEIRRRILDRSGGATCLGFGPRFLHSTGQAYKGGGNNGVFLQITSDDAFDLTVPGQKYTFGVVKAAQARGDFQVLLDRGRRALRVHLGEDVSRGLHRLAEII